MDWASGLVLLTGAWPLWRAWQANRRTTLRQAVLWAVAAWAAWGLVFLGPALTADFDPALGRHAALALTGCAAVAVLGARRPGVAAWNFVVCGLLVVLMLPVAEGLGTLRLDTPHAVFLGATLVVGLGNYLPTRAGPATVLLGLGVGTELAVQLSPSLREGHTPELLAGLCLAAAPWLAWLLLKGGRVERTEFDQTWLGFRDRFGVVWGQRVREQFNRAAAHNGWPVVLHWHGLVVKDGATPDLAAPLDTLRAVLNRFDSEAND